MMSHVEDRQQAVKLLQEKLYKVFLNKVATSIRYGTFAVRAMSERAQKVLDLKEPKSLPVATWEEGSDMFQLEIFRSVDDNAPVVYVRKPAKITPWNDNRTMAFKVFGFQTKNPEGDFNVNAPVS